MYQRISRYYPGCDGTKLAVDLYLPETTEKVPVIFQVANGPRRSPGAPNPMGRRLSRNTSGSLTGAMPSAVWNRGAWARPMA